jgi:hypothetical protein
MKRAIITNNLFVLIDFLPNESDEMFYDRINFIIKKYDSLKDKNKINLDGIINISKIYSNIKYKKCKYGQDIMDLLN